MAKFEFKLPDIGEGVMEGEIVGWLARVGDHLAENQDMVEVMTDKATVTIGAPKAGRVEELRGAVGDTVPVGSVIVVLDIGGATSDSGEETSGDMSSVKHDSATQPTAPVAPRAVSAPAEATGDIGPVASAVGDLRNDLPGMGRMTAPTASQSEQPLAAPATRRLARELGVDLRKVEPSGKGGRVTREDVEAAGARASVSAKPAPTAAVPAPAPSAVAAASELPKAAAILRQTSDQRQPIRGIRKRTAEHMARSKRTAAHFTYVDDCDATGLIAMRGRLAPRAEAMGIKLTFLPFIVKAVIRALRVHPALNSVVDDTAQEIVLRANRDIGIAMSSDAGLFVPVLRDAERLTLLEIAQEIQRLGMIAKSGRFAPEELGGSSFTITSLGKLGGLFATPVINYPEVAILGIHEIKRRPVVQGDQIVIGAEMLLSLSFDHRIIDGHVGAAFAQEIIGLLEEPERLLLEA
jgi:pyruvate dehydrogenase E2 component (dihydrolipoamide acetyltransferase)